MAVVTREQVLKLLQQGKSIDEIKQITGASKGAVKVHIRRLKDTGRWTEPQQPFPEGQGTVETEAQQMTTTIPTTATPTVTIEQANQPATDAGKQITFSSKDDVIDFLVAWLQESKTASDCRKQLGERDYEIGRLKEQIEMLRAELARIKAGIAALQ
jgi:DNA-binding transcriptional ArsR family regulator